MSPPQSPKYLIDSISKKNSQAYQSQGPEFDSDRYNEIYEDMDLRDTPLKIISRNQTSKEKNAQQLKAIQKIKEIASARNKMLGGVKYIPKKRESGMLIVQNSLILND